MPYNNTPIAPSQEITGSCSLPRQCLQHNCGIAQLTKDVQSLASRRSSRQTPTPATARTMQPSPSPLQPNFSFNTSSSRPTRSSEQITRSEGGTSSTKTLVRTTSEAARVKLTNVEAGAVSKYDNLDFLSDVCPQTITFKDYKQRKTATGSGAEDPALTNGQRTLAFGKHKDSGDDTMLEGTSHEQETIRPMPTSSPIAARHSYDAVRDSEDIGPRVGYPMEED